MAVSEEWRNLKFNETFEDEIRGLTRRRKSDPRFSIEDIEDALKNLYIMDGADQGGRGCLQDTVMAAKIAAFEHFIAQWRAEKGSEQQNNL